MDGEEIFTGTHKAAIFLMIMGEDFTADIFRFLDETEIKIIGEHMAQIKNLDPRLVAEVMAEFSQGLGGDAAVGLSGKSFLERSVSKAFDARKGTEIL